MWFKCDIAYAYACVRSFCFSTGMANLGAGYAGALTQPMIVFMLSQFYNETLMAANMGILPGNLWYYMAYAAVFNLPQLVADVLSVLGLTEQNNWPIYEYLEFLKYKYEHRQTRWKGHDWLLDENLEIGKQSIDQLCFQEQFYFAGAANSLGFWGITLFMEGIMQHKYNPFADPLIGIFLFLTYMNYMFCKNMVSVATERLGVWMLDEEKVRKRSLLNVFYGLSDVETARAKKKDANVTGDSTLMVMPEIRKKFVAKNRAYLLSHLSDYLVPDAFRQHGVYLQQQYRALQDATKNISNPYDISDDSEAELNDVTRDLKFRPLRDTDHGMLMFWFETARRYVELRRLTVGMTNAAQDPQCLECGATTHLHVEQLISLEDMVARYDAVSGIASFEFRDATLIGQWRGFFAKNQKFRTRCLSCVSKDDKTRSTQERAGAYISDDTSDDEKKGKEYHWLKPLEPTDKTIVLFWLGLARARRAQPDRVRMKQEKEVSEIDKLLLATQKVKQMQASGNLPPTIGGRLPQPAAAAVNLPPTLAVADISDDSSDDDKPQYGPPKSDVVAAKLKLAQMRAGAGRGMVRPSTSGASSTANSRPMSGSRPSSGGRPVRPVSGHRASHTLHSESDGSSEDDDGGVEGFDASEDVDSQPLQPVKPTNVPKFPGTVGSLPLRVHGAFAGPGNLPPTIGGISSAQVSGARKAFVVPVAISDDSDADDKPQPPKKLPPTTGRLGVPVACVLLRAACSRRVLQASQQSGTMRGVVWCGMVCVFFMFELCVFWQLTSHSSCGQLAPDHWWWRRKTGSIRPGRHPKQRPQGCQDCSCGVG